MMKMTNKNVVIMVLALTIAMSVLLKDNEVRAEETTVISPEVLDPCLGPDAEKIPGCDKHKDGDKPEDHDDDHRDDTHHDDNHDDNSDPIHNVDKVGRAANPYTRGCLPSMRCRT
ncbi:unnamed protein product [Linum trigynum]|uniref:Uncharacterized protein n=1 Tax=Linum trigynum TaxID=586398 RepID=A0AAV2EXE1_9ROSI